MRQLLNIEMHAIHGGLDLTTIVTVVGSSLAGTALGGGYGYLMLTAVPGGMDTTVSGIAMLLQGILSIGSGAALGLLVGMAAGLYYVNLE